MNNLQEVTDTKEVITVIMGENSGLVAKANSVVIETGDDLNVAADLLSEIKARLRDSEKKRKEIVKPFNDGVKVINSNFKEVSAPLMESEKIIKGKMLPVQQRLMREEQERAEKQRAEREAELLRIAEDKAEKGLDDDSEKLLEKAVLVKAKVDNSDIGRGGFLGAKSVVTKRWDFEVEDILLFAKKYPHLIQVDSVGVRKIITSGTHEIAGLKVFQKETISVR